MNSIELENILHGKIEEAFEKNNWLEFREVQNVCKSLTTRCRCVFNLIFVLDLFALLYCNILQHFCNIMSFGYFSNSVRDEYFITNKLLHMHIVYVPSADRKSLNMFHSVRTQ